MKFNSQICTSREQSERLLELGLKKETADMSIICKYVGCDDDGVLIYEENIYPYPPSNERISPAWSLHRLIEMALRYILIMGVSFSWNEDAYEKVIWIIDYQIKEGYFNKEYLEE